ncbi:MAG TPA: glycoside hydrolase family 11 protein [Polyangia bacterium]|nr:glycoside hydrolase family 11 protein [Polyangia bacterium]
MAVAALLSSCASPTSDNGGTGDQGGSLSGATGSGGLGGMGAPASGGATGSSRGGAAGPTGGSGAGGGGGSTGGTGGPSTGAGGSTGGNGGSPAGGHGGATGVGGGSGAGGSKASGGSTGTGGAAGASGGGGGSGVGGASGKGGQPGTGGNAGSGGATGTGGTSGACTPGAPWTGGQQYSANSVGNAGNGYSYQLWFTGGSGSMTVAGVDAKFSATWNDPTDFLARVGLTWSSTQTFDQLGTVSADFAHTKTGSAGYSFIGIYGWSVSPIVEYYIVEDWYGSPPTADGGAKMGTFTVDGGTYDVYQHTQVNQPSVTGANATFPQFYSIRQTPRQCGHISITEHYKEWASLGLTLGKMEEAKILVEVGGGGTGNIAFMTATVTAK